jgi:hypothetical protein
MGLLPTRYLSVAGEYTGAVHIPLAELERAHARVVAA